jgi:CheY-like chemotaxis protein
MNFKILVIDDEPILRDSLQVALSTSGYQVQTARTGEEGLELFRKENPDLILLDHWLPGMNGDEVLRKIKEENGEVPIIIMTARVPSSGCQLDEAGPSICRQAVRIGPDRDPCPKGTGSDSFEEGGRMASGPI